MFILLVIWGITRYSLNNLIESFCQANDSRVTSSRERDFIWDQLWPICPHIAVFFLECINFLSQTHISFVYHASSVNNSLYWLMWKLLPCYYIFKWFIDVEGNEKHLTWLSTITYRLQEIFRIAHIKKCVSCPCLIPLLEYRSIKILKWFWWCLKCWIPYL